MKKLNKKSLALSTETVRSLEHTEMSGIGGADSGRQTCYPCVPQSTYCSLGAVCTTHTTPTTF
jgi:hypothetical protein